MRPTIRPLPAFSLPPTRGPGGGEKKIFFVGGKEEADKWGI